MRKGDLCYGLGRGATSEAGSVSSEKLMCGGGVRSSFFVISFCGYVPRANRYVYMVHVCFYVLCSDCVGICGNVCCVAGVVKDSVLAMEL